MKSNLPKKFDFLGYFFGASVRLYRSEHHGKLHVYLIPSNASLFDYKRFEISKDYACFLITNCTKI